MASSKASANDSADPKHSAKIVQFWFSECTPQQWWAKDDDFDRLIQRRFGVLHEQAAQGQLQPWNTAPDTCLALILLLDQFSRNIYRDNKRAFDNDEQTLTYVHHGLAQHFLDQLTSVFQKQFFITPLMHSEKRIDQDLAVELMHQHLTDHPEFESVEKFFLRHQEIIQQFGRFPHRNQILERVSTSEEKQFLTTPFSSF